MREGLLRRHWPGMAAVGLYWAVLAVLLVMATRRTGGVLVYALDDAYIHMAMAKNIALHHMWGVTRYEFSSSTSSPLWTLMLALVYAVVGVTNRAPFLLNAAAGTLILLSVDHWLAARAPRPVFTFAVLVVLMFVAPLPAMTFAGMEHLAHGLATLWLTFTAAAALAAAARPDARTTAVITLLGAATTGLRYEGAFLVAIIAALFVVTRRPIAGLSVAVGGLLPVVAYGMWSTSHGWYFLPNSVLLKGHMPALTARSLLAFAAWAPALHNLMPKPELFVTLVAALVALLLVTAGRAWGEDAYLLTMLAGAMLLHAEFANTGWFYRYEAYLLILGAAVLGAVAVRHMPSPKPWSVARVPRYAAACALCAIVGFPFASRGLNALRNVPLAVSNLYQQQYQMALFLDRFYPGRTIAVNDIGAVSYLTDVHVLDVYGLASLETARLRLAGRYNSSELATLATEKGAAIAIVYPTWFGEYGGVPPAWTKVAQWGVVDNIVLGESAVSLYAVAPGEVDRLAEHAAAFAVELPREVVQSAPYRKQG